MAIPKKLHYITIEEYLAGELKSATKHEYVDGEVYAMAGESKRHNRISFTLARLFEECLSNTNCETYFEGVKVRASQTVFYYPDVVVTCETDKEDDDYVVKFPCLIIEVLSPSTAQTDRREKLIAYKMIESLQEYAIVWQDEMRVELHRRQDQGWLTLFFTQPEDEVEFTAINYKINLSDIYRNITFEQ